VATASFVGGWTGAYRFESLRAERMGSKTDPPSNLLDVPLWLPETAVRHKTRFSCLWDGQASLAAFRRQEKLDAVVGHVASDEERARKLPHWTRAQFEPGRPDPYPPPDAMTTLAEIRAGRTGGFCAQYAFVLVQALQSFGMPARVITIDRHEVVETWLADTARWTMLDPFYELQVVDERGVSVSAIEIRRGRQAGAPLAVTPGGRLDQPLAQYLGRYDRIAVWIRNAFVSAPVNFADFDRYRVWLVPTGEFAPSSESLSTTHFEGLYGRPADFPYAAHASGSSLAGL
jgi:hypothetical protein